MDDYQEKFDAITKKVAELFGPVTKKTKASGFFAKKKPAKTEMMAQSLLGNVGPALFMEGSKVVLQRGDKIIREKVWRQPRELPERTSKRSLRLRKGKVRRGTTKV